jgi:hypothetical protein
MNQNQERVNLNQFKVNEPESIGEATARNLIRTGSRVGETVLGQPGLAQEQQQNAMKSALTHGTNAVEKITGTEFPNFREKIEGISKFVTPKGAPTPAELKKGSQKISKGLTTASGPSEKFADDITETATSLAMGGGNSVARIAATSTAANAVPWLVKSFGGGEKAQEYAKMATLVLSGMIQPGAAQQSVKNLYKTRDNLVPLNTTVGARNLAQKLEKISRTAASGGKTEGSSAIIEYINSLKNNIKNGRIGVKDLTNAKVKVNINRGRYSKNEDDRRLFNDIADVLDREIASYGHSNPAFYKAHTAADLAHGTIKQGEKISHFLTDHANEIPKGHYTRYLFKASGKGLEAAAAPAELVYRVWKDPTLRKHYAAVLENAARESLPATIKSINQLEKSIEKENKKNGKIDFEQFRSG